jgi:diadenosine tetraphosphate (Ap4A) HIT family hydrolase
MHVHFHVIPKTGDGGLELRWRPGAIEHERGAALAERIRAAIDAA